MKKNVNIILFTKLYHNTCIFWFPKFRFSIINKDADNLNDRKRIKNTFSVIFLNDLFLTNLQELKKFNYRNRDW